MRVTVCMAWVCAAALSSAAGVPSRQPGRSANASTCSWSLCHLSQISIQCHSASIAAGLAVRPGFDRKRSKTVFATSVLVIETLFSHPLAIGFLPTGRTTKIPSCDDLDVTSVTRADFWYHIALSAIAALAADPAPKAARRAADALGLEKGV